MRWDRTICSPVYDSRTDTRVLVSSCMQLFYGHLYIINFVLQYRYRYCKCCNSTCAIACYQYLPVHVYSVYSSTGTGTAILVGPWRYQYATRVYCNTLFFANNNATSSSTYTCSTRVRVGTRVYSSTPHSSTRVYIWPYIYGICMYAILGPGIYCNNNMAILIIYML